VGVPGLEHGEKVICTAVGLAPERTLAATLETRGIDAAGAVRDGRLAVLPLPEFYPPAGQASPMSLAAMTKAQDDHDDGVVLPWHQRSSHPSSWTSASG